MSSTREQILAAVLVNLLTVTGLSSSNCFRTRLKPLPEQSYPYVTFEPVSDVPEANDLGYIDWDLTIKLTLFHKGSVPDSQADALLLLIKSKMLADRNLGDLAADVMPGPITWDFTLGSAELVEIESFYTIKYREMG